MKEGLQWRVEGASWSRMVRHALEMYPNEACGILLSEFENPGHIAEVFPTKNVSEEDQANRYLVDPLEFLEADKWAEEKGLDICGFYHSHPDHPSVPSEHDRKLAWEGYLYLILSIRGSAFQDARAWIYDSETGRFQEVPFQHPARIEEEDQNRKRALRE